MAELTLTSSTSLSVPPCRDVVGEQVKLKTITPAKTEH